MEWGEDPSTKRGNYSYQPVWPDRATFESSWEQNSS